MNRSIFRGGLVGQRLDYGKLRRTHVLRVDGNERGAAAGCDYLRPHALENFHEHVAPYSGVLIDQEALAAERCALEVACETLDPSEAGLGVFRWKSLVTGLEQAAFIKQGPISILIVEPPAHLSHLLVDRCFLLLEQLALAAIGFVTIAVERNMAAGDHHAASAAH